ncbi:transcriptional regulatory protein Sin3p [[Candida] jaroonii]|uniref:Transcriptional regulatory protein Sin3p n=1 Tax=[Candida] jaroonii TaxID=467808 RepID=A0ACA9Y1X4_9ASCO|nr:transcriptional regulatory protein Sin3p [[Candida] jaroonii]
MSNQDPWGSQKLPLGQNFNGRQNPPVLPPPATLETGGQKFYPLPSLQNLGNHQNHSFNIPSINTNDDRINGIQVGGQAQPQAQPQPNQVRQTLETQPTNSQSPETNQTNGQSQSPQNQPNSSPSNQTIPMQPVLGQPASHIPSHENLTQYSAIAGMNQNVPNRSTTSQVYRPLNVKDALSYLDQVKIQFYNQADVYNNFLDIMKDFKSQTIDTPGVIDRVSNLFKGHPNLIQGFNTFLPPGYRIECSLDPSNNSTIKVHTPAGTTTVKSGMNYSESWNEQQQAQAAEAAQAAQAAQAQQLQYDQQAQAAQHQGGQILAQGPNNQEGNSDQMNHAITYVNKIKTRFANQPDIYKQFLEILQTYQREQKPIGEVYEQVTLLFSNSPDLLDDFKQFLPDTSGSTTNGSMSAATTSGNTDGTFSQLPPVGNFQQQNPAYSNPYEIPNNENVHQDWNHQMASQYQQPKYPGYEYDMNKKMGEGYNYENNYNNEAQYSSMRSDIQPKIKPGSQVSTKNGITTITNPTLVPGIPEPVPNSYLGKASSIVEEMNFFDKVKKAIGNKQTYNDFLKILSLYTQEVIDKSQVVERVESFLGEQNEDLINWFKMFIGFDDKPLHIEDIHFKKHQLELSLCKANGPSYRELPKSETYMPCSGRDEMCWEVLNDEWVGHPTWASEDSGFIAHRKNQYEEILFRIEEERLEYDYHMEANLRTIQTLETIANRIANMTPEQKANFKLPPGLGHTSVTIYKKVIRKIYDKDKGFEVIDALHESPAIAVPIVLKRLKQKDEEWRRAQREWNKVWREMEQKVFYKSLDHLGLTFKQSDKKLLTAKQLVSEISTVKIEQHNKRLYPLTPKPQEQLNYKFNDFDIISDILRLSEVFISKSSNYSTNDREKLSQFFKHFVSLFFGKEFESKEEPIEVETPIESSEESSSMGESRKRQREDDLLRNVLKKQTRKEDVPSSDSEDLDIINEVEKSSELWITTTGRKFSLKDNETSLDKRDIYNFFCNTTIYVFFRHLRILYERLEEVKSMNDEVAKEIEARTYPQFAKDLNLLSRQFKELNVEISGKKDCYQQVLSLSERLIEGELDHQWFEESIRQAYRNKAYKIYTIDKVVSAMIKHMHTMITDGKTSEMVLLFENDRNTPISTAKDQILYRMNVRGLMSNDENMFKIVYKEKEDVVNIQFVSLDDLTLNDHKTAEEHYNYYVTSYVMSHPTEGVSASKINMPFSKDFIEQIEEDQCNGFVDSNLKVSICENSYRLFYEPDGHDEFTANTIYEHPIEDNKSRDDKLSFLKKFIEDEEIGWKSTLKDGANSEVYDNKIQALFTKGLKEFKDTVVGDEADDVEEEESKDIVMKDPEPKVIDKKSHPDMTIDADVTVVQDHNDTTIQQDANDTTADDNTVNETMS